MENKETRQVHEGTDVYTYSALLDAPQHQGPEQRSHNELTAQRNTRFKAGLLVSAGKGRAS